MGNNAGVNPVGVDQPLIHCVNDDQLIIYR